VVDGGWGIEGVRGGFAKKEGRKEGRKIEQIQYLRVEKHHP
jgi:hypothetical protein